MARKKELTVCISPEGLVTIEVDGVRGASCLELTRELEENLGFILEREKKPAFYEEEKALAAAGRAGEGKP
jgi:hypothetical protein